MTLGTSQWLYDPLWLYFSCRVDATEDGDYRLCFDNSFSKLSEKMVFFEVIINSQSNAGGGRDDWADVALEESVVEYKLEDIRVRRQKQKTALRLSDVILYVLAFIRLSFLRLLLGGDGLCVPAPGEDPPGPDSAAGLWGEGPLPSGGQPVAGVLLVLPQPARHDCSLSHSDLQPATPLWWHQEGPHIATKLFY